MVASSRTRQWLERTHESPPLTVRPYRVEAAIQRISPFWAGTALYLLAAVALLSPWPFGALPGWAYNWEGYTAWRWSTYWEPPVGPTYEIWAPNDGLMTDSGQGPLVGFPVALGIAFAGFNVDAMRVPVVLVAAAAPPLLWLFGRPIVGSGPSLLAAMLLTLSPGFLLYGRSATLVGVSLVPVLLTAIALRRVVEAPSSMGGAWSREGLLVGSLLLGMFSYAPVRLLWPLTIAFLCLTALDSRSRRRVLMSTAVICALAVPLGTMTLEQLARSEPDPVRAALGYFQARGEQFVAMVDEPERAREYVRDPELLLGSSEEPLRLLIGQNSADLLRLLVDHDTNPVLTDYWNETGRFWPWYLALFAAVGPLTALARGLRGSLAAFLPLFLFAGLIAPLLLTSRVHVGRMLPALPFGVLLAAAGFVLVTSQLVRWMIIPRADWFARTSVAMLAFAVLVPAAVSARADFDSVVAPSRETLTAATLSSWHSAAVERGGGILVEDPAIGDDIERVHAATYRLELDRLFQFVDLRRGDLAAADSRPKLYWHGTLDALAAGEIANPCNRLWFVAPEVAVAFLDTWRNAGCLGAPDSVVLP